MKTLGKIFGIVGIIMFIFGIVAYILTRVNSVFFYVHIFGGLALLLLYFIFTYKGTKEFLGLTLMLMLTFAGSLVTGTSESKLFFMIPALLVLAIYSAFNFRITKDLKILLFTVIPVILAVAYGALRFSGYLTEIEKHFYYLIAWGVLLCSAHAVLNFSRLKEGVFGKQTKYAVNVLVYTVIFFGIIIVLNALGYYVNLKKDFTENKVNTLSEQSVKVIKSLKEDVSIIPFFVDKNKDKEILKDMLSQYSAESKKITVEFIDPDLKPQSAKQHNAKDGDIVVLSGLEETIITDISEETMTSAIIKVTRTAKPVVCFTSGHGEMGLDDEGADGMKAVAGGIANEGYETKKLESLNEGIPNECDIIAVAGPKIPFARNESKAIDDYLKKGGKGLFMLDPRLPDPKLGGNIYVLDTGLEDLAKRSGVKLGKNLVLERHIQLFAGMTLESSVQARNFGDHPIVNPLKGKITLLPRNVRSVGREGDKNSGTVTEIIFSDAKKELSWAESDVNAVLKRQFAEYGPGDMPGPVPVAVAIEKNLTLQEKEREIAKDDPKMKKRDKTKSVWIGNSYFASNNYVRSMEFNYDLFLNMLSWLWGEEEKISIRPKMLKTSSLILTPEQNNMVFYVAVLGIPEIILIFGLVIWFKRRKK